VSGPTLLEQEIGKLADLPRDELVRRWKDAFASAPPRGVKRGLLELGIAWQLQVRQYGGMSPATKRQMQKLVAARRGWRQLAEDASAAGASVGQASGRQTLPAQHALLSPGTRLVREWHGRTHHVDVIEDGFVFEGKTHASLSAIARQITGAHWSGPRFFGLHATTRNGSISE
jgi:hypothetical protein